jgi:transposase
VPPTRPPYPAEFRREAVELVRISSKSQHRLAEDLGVSDVTLRNWVKQAECGEGKRRDGLSRDEREELARLRRENLTLRMERETLKEAAAFFAREPTRRRRGVVVRRGGEGQLPDRVDVSGAWREPHKVSGLEAPRAIGQDAH